MDDSAVAAKPIPVKTIFDTDMLDDCAAAGAMATLNKLADLGEAEILACVVNSRGEEKASAATVSAINTYYGRPQIPIGTYPGIVKKVGRAAPTRPNYGTNFRTRLFPMTSNPSL